MTLKKSLKIINTVAIFMLIALFVVLNGFAVRYNKHITSYLCGFGVDYSSSE